MNDSDISKLIKEFREDQRIILGESITPVISRALGPITKSVTELSSDMRVITNTIEDHSKKLTELFQFHNVNVETIRSKDLDFMMMKKDLETVQKDINGLGYKIEADVDVTEKVKTKVEKVENSYSVLSKVGTVTATIVGIVLAYLSLKGK